MLDATPLLKLYSLFRLAQLARMDPVGQQEHELRRLLGRAAETKFGTDYDFRSIRTVVEYQSRVPLRTYEQFWFDYWKPAFPQITGVTWPEPIPYFAVSSGTSSGTTKYLPISERMNRSNSKAGLDLLVQHIANRPRTRIFGGKCFLLGGSTNFVHEGDGVYSGDLSGIAAKTMPWWARSRTFPPPHLALLKDWEKKIDAFVTQGSVEDIRMISGVPSWMLIFFDRLQRHAAATGRDPAIAEIFPNLEMIVHGGVSFAPYRARFAGLLSGSGAELREVYPASEGFIALADRGYGEGLRVLLDHGTFMEFVPFEELDAPAPTRHWISNIECGVNYAIVLTTCAGLWSYIVGDTVKFIDRDPPRLLITGRTSYYLSAFGEHLIEEEVEDGVTSACRAIAAMVCDFSVGPLYPRESSQLGGHVYVVEFVARIPSAEEIGQFAAELDRTLCARNEDYAAHRADGFGLNPPRIEVAPSGAFAAWMKHRGKLGGQHKVPRIIANIELLEDLREFVKRHPVE